jgi:hypothetical protein
MKKPILITLCVTGLMLFTPFTTVAQENKVADNLKYEPDKEELVTQLRGVINEILQKYGHIPIVKSIFTWILSYLIWILSVFIWIFSYIKYFLIITYCVSFFIIIMLFSQLMMVMYRNGFSHLGELTLYFGLFLILLYYITGCGWFPPYNPLNPISYLKKTNYITNHPNDSPCLQ